MAQDGKKFFGEIAEIDIKHNEKYDLFLYDVICYHDSNFKNLSSRSRIASFNKPLDLRIGQRYFFRNLGWNEKFKNLLWVEDSSFIAVQKNDLWSYM